MYKTSYYDDFKCIGSECPNSCCVGWEIDLDINTFQKYRDLQDNNIYKCISINQKPTYDKFAKIKKVNDQRCSFLDKDNLCNIQKKYSEKLLSPTCSNFPRRKVDFGSKQLSSCLLSCPEISRIYFEDNEQFKIIDNEKKLVDTNLKIIPDEFRNNLYAVSGERIFNFFYKLYNSNDISLEKCLMITNQIINEFSNKKIKPYKGNEVFEYVKSFFLNNKIEKKIDTELQLEFLKKFFRCFQKKKINNKLSQLINKLYTDCFLNTDIKKIRLLFEKNKLHNFNKFLLKHPNIFKKFFIHEFFGKTQLLTNEEIDSKDGFYLIFFIALVSKLILILKTLPKDQIVVKDFIEVISLISRYYGGKDNLDKEEKELVYKDNKTFENLFYLFFG
tara:strand:- start:103 stop:1266 length:1164 start_codon:yes stop_codon:yes gene_type:complete